MTSPPTPPRADPLASHPLAKHTAYWRQIAAEERANGFLGLAADYDRLADHAERLCQMGNAADRACRED